MSVIALVAVAVVGLWASGAEAAGKGDCVVCARVFDSIYATLSAADKKDVNKIEAKIGQFCEKQSDGEVCEFSSRRDVICRRLTAARRSHRADACAIRSKRSSDRRRSR